MLIVFSKLYGKLKDKIPTLIITAASERSIKDVNTPIPVS